ncbi:Gfo/Idh/MocA family protein [Halothermothrix orenii]|uniref:Gfo/Idh/MocA family protein n=1 Tax=Halothermothrix orenii TaxID=31909 RepID=UPI0002E7D0C4|nr:Gfo/Idh/MocA family oxidoreductase [Halothermothrix orenii]
MSEPVTVAVLGAGNRGREAYGEYILRHPEEIRVVAVAEPDKDKRSLFSKEHNIPEENQFSSWEELLSRERLADGIIIATLDKMHIEPTRKALKRGYDILLEKPIAPTLQETISIAREAQKYSNNILVAHVLRYTNFYRGLKEILKKGIIGKIRFVDHIENIGFYHFAHSYVRGNWRNTEVAAPIILAKSCHDMDILYWLLEKKCKNLSSHASLEYFTEKNQPEGASDRCLYCGVEEDCPYSARKIYLNENTGWPASVITTDLSYEGRYKALKEGPYGRCVFKCDNNVPEVQTVRMLFEDDIEVNFALTAFSNEITRTTNIYGSKGEIRADFENGVIEIYEFGRHKSVMTINKDTGGHGGGDTGLMKHFVKVLRGELKTEGLTSLSASIESHIMAFAAEKARDRKSVISLDELKNDIINK